MSPQQKEPAMRTRIVRAALVAAYWPAGEAAARFGMGHPRGVIELMRT
jgi:hypothetical protein